MGLTPEQEAAYALDYGVRRADLKPHVQALYDRLLDERKAAANLLSAASYPPTPATWQGVPPSWRTKWAVWLLFAGLSGVVTAFIVGAFGGSNPKDAANLAAGVLLLFAVAGVCVAIPALLYRRYRARRMTAQPPRWPFAPCYGCRYPLAVHLGDALQCPLDGMCYRCGQPLTVHAGYQLTCPGSAMPHCYRCGQPLTTHAGDGRTCPAPWVSAPLRT
jgi:hypothetical protein